MKDDSILLRARVPVDRYRSAERVLDRLGLKPGDAVNALFAQIELRQGLPFEVALARPALLSPEQQADAWTNAFGDY